VGSGGQRPESSMSDGVRSSQSSFREY
jgi:hypothetical protein